MSWYVVEGPDDTGKTTLARYLERRGWEYQHATEVDTLPLLAGRLAGRQDVENVVWDRAHLGNTVHDQVDRHQATPEGWRRLIEAFLLSRHSVNVLLTQRYRRPDDPFENDRERHNQLCDAFWKAALHSFLYWHRTWPDPMPSGYTDNQEDDVLPWSTGRLDPEGLGSVTPAAWVLGEQQSEASTVPWPLATRCGIELVWPVVDPRTFRVSNAAPSLWRGSAVFVRRGVKILSDLRSYQVDAYADLHDRWDELGKPRVIALGKKTVFHCQMADVDVWRELPHPQYWLRFHAHEGDRYRTWLERALLDAERELLKAIRL